MIKTPEYLLLLFDIVVVAAVHLASVPPEVRAGD